MKGNNKRESIFSMETGKTLRLAWDGAGWWNVLSLSLSLIRSIIPLAIILLIKGLIDTVSDLSLTPTSPDYHNMVWLICGIATAFLAEEIASSLSAYVTRMQAAAMSLYVHDKLHEKASSLDLIHFETSSFYDRLLRATREAASRPLSIASNLVNLFRGLVSLVVMAVLLAGFNWLIALVLAVITLPLLLLRTHYSALLWNYRKETASDERKSSYYSWLLTGDRPAREIRLFGTADYFRKLFRESFSRVTHGEARLLKRRAQTEIIIAFAKAAGLGVILWYMITRTVHAAISLGELAMYLLAFRQGLLYVREIASSVSGLHEDSLFVKDTFDFLGTPVDTKEGTIKIADNIAGEISVRDVDFAYPGSSSNTLEKISLTIREGESIAIVGSNGAGKSTLARIICGLYKADKGSVYYGGKEVGTLDSTSYRKLFSVVFQDFMLYNLSLGENIGLGDVSRIGDSEKIREAAVMTGLDQLVGTMENGYSTVIGRLFDDSRELSWGEWQKIAIARALFRNSPVIILDEPTSALDANAEFEFYSRFREMRKGRSSILISHRLATVADADRIVLLSEGVIAESGTHEELMKARGKYYDMYSRQAGMYR